jgi:hypothetical protein
MVTAAALTSDISLGLGILGSFGPAVDVVGIYANGAGNGPASPTGIASSIINSVLGIPGTSPSMGQQFPTARPLKAFIRETSKIMEHPLETGVMLADHHIINPVEIEIPVVIANTGGGLINSLIGGASIPYATVYAAIRQAFIDAVPFSIKTNVGVYSDMVIWEMPHEEDPERFDVITINLKFRQAIFINAGATAPNSNFQPLDPLNTNTLATGLQQAATIGTQVLAGASGIASYAALAQKGFL